MTNFLWAPAAWAPFSPRSKGRMGVDECLRTLQFPNVYLVGDAASFLDPETGKELPPTGPQKIVNPGPA